MSEIGVIGLGQMGSALAAHALDLGIGVAGTSRSGVPAELREAGLEAAEDAGGLVAALDRPRRVLLSLPAGPVIDTILDDLCPRLEPGDVVLDGANSYWGDSIRRSERLARDGLHFLDLGVSGGPEGARHAPCFMIGGPREGIDAAEPLLRRLAGEAGGYVHAGGPGAGHFVKLVHNGIEFGMLQAIGEGLALLKAHAEPLDIGGTLEAWRHGSVIRSWLMDLMAEAYARDPDLACPSGLVEDTGEVNWLVGDAMVSETPIPVIAQSVMELMKTRDKEGVAARAITHMRHGFGGHRRMQAAPPRKGVSERSAPHGPGPAVAVTPASTTSKARSMTTSGRTTPRRSSSSGARPPKTSSPATAARLRLSMKRGEIGSNCHPRSTRRR